MFLKEEVLIKPYGEMRTLHMYYPDVIDPENLPGVFYFFDGHNLFFDEAATYGKSWGMADYLEKHPLNVMIVGLECNHEGNLRLCEFSPYSFNDDVLGDVQASGKALFEWMRTDLKATIESHFAVDGSRMKTAIGGSSMGGLMAIYGGAVHHDTYAKAACLSPFHRTIMHPLLQDIHQQDLTDTTFYLSWGANEFRNKRHLAQGSEANLKIARALTKQNATVYPYLRVYGSHNEASWEKEVPLFMKELGITQF